MLKVMVYKTKFQFPWSLMVRGRVVERFQYFMDASVQATSTVFAYVRETGKDAVLQQFDKWGNSVSDAIITPKHVAEIDEAVRNDWSTP